MGPSLRRLQPSRTALLVIDMQRDFLDPGGYAAQAGLDISRLRQAITPIRALLAAARHERVSVAHTREGHLPDLSDCPPAKLERSRAAGAPIGSQGPLGRLLLRGEHGHDFIDELQPWPGELVVDKPGYSAFEHTRTAGLAGRARHRHAGPDRRDHRGVRELDAAHCRGSRLSLHHGARCLRLLVCRPARARRWRRSASKAASSAG